MPSRPRKLDQLGGFGVNFRIAVDVAPDVEAHRMLRLQRQPQVLVDRQAAEQVGDLERTGEALLADAVRRQALNVAAVEAHGAAVRRVQARDQVEQRGLAGAVRADQGMDLAGADREAGVGDGTDAAEMFRDAVDLQHRSLHRLRAQERRQRQAFVDLALAHRGGFFRQRAPAPAQRRPDADQAARRVQHEGDEDQSEPEQPVRRPDRKQFAEQDEEQRAERRPQHAAHAADHDHRQQLAGKRHRHRFGRNQVGLESEQRAGQPRHHRRDHEHAELVALDRIALERGAQLVLADRHQHVAERRAHHAQQHVQHGRARSARPRCRRRAHRRG